MRKIIRISYNDLHKAYPTTNTIKHLDDIIPFKNYSIIDEDVICNEMDIEYFDITREELIKVIKTRKNPWNFILVVNTNNNELIQSKLSFKCKMEIL